MGPPDGLLAEPYACSVTCRADPRGRAIERIQLGSQDAATQVRRASRSICRFRASQPGVLLAELRQQLIDALDVLELLRIARPELIGAVQLLPVAASSPIGP